MPTKNNTNQNSNDQNKKITRDEFQDLPEDIKNIIRNFLPPSNTITAATVTPLYPSQQSRHAI